VKWRVAEPPWSTGGWGEFSEPALERGAQETRELSASFKRHKGASGSPGDSEKNKRVPAMFLQGFQGNKVFTQVSHREEDYFVHEMHGIDNI